MKLVVVPIVTGAHDTAPKGLVWGREGLEIRGRVGTI